MPYTCNAETPSVTRRPERPVRSEGVSLIRRARYVAPIDAIRCRGERVAYGPIRPPSDVSRDEQLCSACETAGWRDADAIPVDLRKDLDRRACAQEPWPRVRKPSLVQLGSRHQPDRQGLVQPNDAMLGALGVRELIDAIQRLEP